MFDAFKIGIAISVVDRASTQLGIIGRQFATTNQQATALRGTLDRLRALTAGGFLGAGVATVGVRMLEGMARPAMEYAHQLSLMNAAGMQHQEIVDSIKSAWETTRQVSSTTAADNLKSIREMKMVFGDTADAIKFLPQMQRIAAVLQNVLGGEAGGMAKDVAYSAAKALELRGASRTPEEFQKEADLITRAVIASGGKVTPRDILQAQKYGGVGTTHYGNDFMYGILPSIVQELGGMQTGTALTSMYQALSGGQVSMKSVQAWRQLGLTNDADIEFTGAGLPKRASPGWNKLFGQFQQSPMVAMQSLQQAMTAHGLDTVDKQQGYLAILFGNRTAQRIANIMVTQAPRLLKDFNVIGEAGTSSAYSQMQAQDPTEKLKIFQSQLENLRTILGTKILPILNPALDAFASALMGMAKWAEEHPTLAKAIVLITGGLTAAGLAIAAVAGTAAAFMAIGAAPVVSAVAVALAAVATGIGLLWSTIQGIPDAIMAIVHRIQEFVGGSWIGRQIGLDAAIAPSKGAGSGSGGNVYLDGRKVGQVVSEHQARSMALPATQGRQTDPRAFFPQPGFVGH